MNPQLSLLLNGLLFCLWRFSIVLVNLYFSAFFHLKGEFVYDQTTQNITN